MNSRNSGSASERFFAGKGFYIVLFLCAAVIGMSVWAMNAGSETMYEDVTTVSVIDEPVRETVFVTPEPKTEESASEPQAETEEQGAEDDLTDILYPEGATAAETQQIYLWPVGGELDRSYAVETLAYDSTMADWRTHAAIDISCAEGETVRACHAGTVESIYNDDLLGTVMVINHGDGVRSVYANLDEQTSVGVGTWVAAGVPVANVNGHAIGESAQQPHLHFAMYRDGQSINPTEYLSEG